MTRLAIKGNRAGVKCFFGNYSLGVHQDWSKTQIQVEMRVERRTFALVVKADGLQNRMRSMVRSVQKRKWARQQLPDLNEEMRKIALYWPSISLSLFLTGRVSMFVTSQ